MNVKITPKLIKQIEIEAKKYFIGASGCHDFSHVERVYKLALKIGEQEGADLDILTLAVLLHDIGRKAEMKSKGKFCHAEKGAELARKILGKYKLDSDIINQVVHCIISHRYRNAHVPKTIEAKVLFDADKLDSIGAVGVARDFLFAGYLKSPLYTGNELKIIKSGQDGCYSKEDTAILEYEFKLKNIKTKILTKAGRQIAKGRHDFMTAYFKRFWREVEGVE